jgi:hypothetical protein
MNVQQANARLPLVRLIVKDIMDGARELRAVRKDLARLRDAAGAREDARRAALEEEERRIAETIESCMAELAEIGAELKDFDMGLVDFPARVGSRTVYLCWKWGEPAVRFWHEVEAGYAGRRPIEDLA